MTAPRAASASAIVKYTPEYVERVREFNARIARGGWGEFQLASDAADEAPADEPIRWERWLAVWDGVVRGGFQLKHQEFSFSGRALPVAFYNLSLSEGVIDRAYASVSLKMVCHALAANPLLFSLGMGARDKPLPRLLAALGWTLYDVPFFFRVLHASRVLRNLGTAGAGPLRRAMMHCAAYSGLGAAACRLMQARWRSGAPVGAVAVAGFDAWAESLWEERRAAYSMIGCRNPRTLNALYPESTPGLTRLKVQAGGSVAGWAVVRHTRMHGDRHFGDLYVGSIVDCLARDAGEQAVIDAATHYLEGQGVDLVISNQAHSGWCSALGRAGYLSGPSNYIFAASRPLAKLLAPFDGNVGRIHLNRGDGDGPIHL